MSFAYYTVDPIKKDIQVIAYVVKVYRQGDLVKSVNFPVSNPHFPQRSLNGACEFGRRTVRTIIDMELYK